MKIIINRINTFSESMQNGWTATSNCYTQQFQHLHVNVENQD